MATVLTIGGARFIGRFTVKEFLERGDDVTLFTRGNTPIPFDESSISHVQGDRRNDEELQLARETVDPDIVVDFAAFSPDDVRTATEIFANVEAYIYVSSTSAYRQEADFQLREGRTPLRSYSPELSPNGSEETYGARKAEGDRVVFDAAARGVDAMSVRPTAIYGPYDPTERQNYWIDRVERFDKIIVPYGELRIPLPLGYVEDVATAIRLVVERGKSGEAYNVANREKISIVELIEHIAKALDTNVTVVPAGRDTLATVDLSLSDFSLCRSHPYIVSTEKLVSLGWESTPFETGIANAVGDHRDRNPDGTQHGPSRDTEERLLTIRNNSRDITGR